MSETLNKISLHSVTAPSLKQTTYAEKLSGVFDNIDHNFSVLANPEFTKGERGESVEFVEMPFFDGDELNDLGKKLIECIQSISTNTTEYNDITYYVGGVEKKLSLFDNFYSNPGTLKMIYSVATDTHTSEPMTSLHYVFLDGRYANNVIGKIDESYYSNTRDMSCVVVYERSINGFKVLSNAFPTIYYERNVGLCWKVNGACTGIPVKGLPGRDGYNARLHIVKCNSVDVTDGYIRGIVDSIYGIYDGYIALTERYIDQYENQSAVILINSGEHSGFYFGYLSRGTVTNPETGKVTDVLFANCDHETAVNAGVSVRTFIDTLKGIDLLDNSDVSNTLKGLFVPISKSENNVQAVHLLTSTFMTNGKGDTVSDRRNDVIFTPVNDINSLNVSDDADKSLEVDKYLYLKVNTKSNIFNERNDSLLNAHTLESNYNGVIKYKLSSKISSVNSIGNVYDKRFGYHDAIGDIPDGRLSDDKVVYYGTLLSNPDLSDVTYTTEHKYTLPKNFAERLNGFSGLFESSELGIYRWEICNDKHSFDISELNSHIGESYDFPNVFSVIYTTSMNPSADTDFLWFNGLEIISGKYYDVEDKYNENGYIMNHPLGDVNGKFVVPGWNAGNNSIFSFMKFIPVYDNDFSIADDASLNLNYNVNITGDASNQKRNMTVNGSVNCDNLSVENIAITKETYSINEQLDNNVANKTTLCKNGLMIQSESCAFGIGEIIKENTTNEKIPALFYCDKTLPNDKIETIPFSELFEMFNEWKSSKR